MTAPDGDVGEWVFDHAGELRCIVRENGLVNQILWRSAETDGFHTVFEVDAVRDLFIPLTFTSDNHRLIAYSNVDRERVALVIFNPSTRREDEVLFADPDYDVFGDDEADHVRYSATVGGLEYAFYTTWRRTYRFFGPSAERTITALEERFPDRVIRLISSTPDRQRHLVKISSDRLAGEYYLFDVPTQSTTFLEADCPWLEEEALSPKRAITFAAPDGRTIHGYLVLPLESNGKNLPVVVNPHGGPHWRDVWEMGRFREIQLLANRGYAVLLVNFRGSTGYGKSFLEAGFKQSGLAVQGDITAGVQYLIDEGIADPNRIAIIGGSYGGYAALAGLAFTPDVYACGVDLFGVSNFFTFLGALAQWTDMEVMYKRIGHPVEDRELLERTSPVLHVERIRVPVLVAQGGRDPVVDPGESDQIVAALKARGIQVEYIYHEDEGHGYFSKGDNWLNLWREIEAFLDKNLQPSNPSR